MKTQKLQIEGMSCGHCVMSVKKELSKLAGVTINAVSIGSADITVDDSGVTDEQLKKAIEEAGYTLVSVVK